MGSYIVKNAKIGYGSVTAGVLYLKMLKKCTAKARLGSNIVQQQN